MAITVQVEGLDKLTAKLNAAPAAVASETRTAMQASLLLFEGTARQKAPQDTRRLAGSITSKIEGSGGNLTGRVGPSVAYGIVMERGRRAGTRMPPPGALRAWAGRHGIPESALWRLARAIGRRGIKARPFLQPAYDQHKATVVKLFERVGVNVVAKLAD